MIMVRCVHEISQAQDQRAAMDALNLASARPDPFSTFAFYAHWMRHAQAWPEDDAMCLWLLLAFRAEVLVGHLALKACRQRVLGLSAVRLNLLTAYVGDRPHVVARPEDLADVSAAFYAHLLSRPADWSLLEFEQQEAGSALLPAPAQASCGAWRTRLWPTQAVGVIEVRWPSLADYFAALSKKARSNVSRQMRALLAAGEVQLLSSDDGRAAPALFELYRRIEPHSWKGRADVAIGRSARSIAFSRGLFDPAAPMPMVVQILLLDGVPIAGLISAVFGHSLYALHIVHDERRAGLGPGSAMLLLGMRLAIERGCRVVNLLWGSGHYKTRWLAQMHATRSLQIYRSGSAFHWRSLLGDLRRRWRGQAPQAQPTLLFNPLRRALQAAGATPSCGPALTPAGTAAITPAAAAERLACAAWIESLRGLPCEWLDNAGLAAAMPFATAPASTSTSATTTARTRAKAHPAGQQPRPACRALS